MRFTLAILAAQGRDIKLDPRYFDAYKKFANKIWNATRFVLMNLEDYKEVPLENLKTVDKWILTRLNKTVKEVTSALENYDFNIAARTIYNFFWDEFCDWYIEASKPRLKTEERHLVQTLLVKTLDTSLRLLHPFMPFLTEELWQKLPVDGESITIAKWPEVEEENIDEAAEKEFTRLMNMIRGVRNVRAEMNLPQSQRVRIFVKGLEITDEMKLLLKTLGNIEEIAIVNEKPQKTATAYVEESVEVYVDLGGLIDFEKEKERLKQNMEKIKKEIDRLEKKLSNKDFLEKAPEEVVEETKERLESNRERLERLESILKDLE